MKGIPESLQLSLNSLVGHDGSSFHLEFLVATEGLGHVWVDLETRFVFDLRRRFSNRSALHANAVAML